MPFFPVDDQAAHHRKLMRAGNPAVGLWTRAGAWCMSEATDGIVARDELPSGSTPGQAKKLVDAGLWHAHGHDCDRCPQPPKGGWVFHDWTDWGPLKTADQIKARREADRERQRERRSRQASRRDNPRDSRRDTTRTSGVSHAPPVPSPVPEVLDVSSHLTVVTAHGIDDDGLDKIATLTGGGRDHASRVATNVLDRTTTTVRDPLAYVLRAVDQDPDRHRAVRRLTRALECPLHVGEFADACRCCAADRKAGDA